MRRLGLGLGDEGGEKIRFKWLVGEKDSRGLWLINSGDWKRKQEFRLPADFWVVPLTKTNISREIEALRRRDKDRSSRGWCYSVGLIMDILISCGHPRGSVGVGFSQALRAPATCRPVSWLKSLSPATSLWKVVQTSNNMLYWPGSPFWHMAWCERT